MDVSPGHILPLVSFTKVGEHGPDLSLLTAYVDATIPMTSTVSPWGKEDPPASIMGRLSLLLGKTKPRQRSWQTSDPEFQDALQIARAVQPADQMDKQHAIIYHMIKHKRQQNHVKNAPPFMIPNNITKEFAHVIQVWILNESVCPPGVRQLPDSTLKPHDVYFHIWMKKISPKKDALVFKQQL